MRRVLCSAMFHVLFFLTKMREKSTIIKFSDVTPVMNVSVYTFCVGKHVVKSTYPAELESA